MNTNRSGHSAIDRIALGDRSEGEPLPLFRLLPLARSWRVVSRVNRPSSPASGSARYRERRDDLRDDRSGVSSNAGHEARALRHLPRATDEE